MANIGEIRGKQADNGNIVYDGYIATRKHYLQFWLEAVPSDRRTSDKSPEYTILEKSKEHGRNVAVGDVYANAIQRGMSAGKRMFSLVFTDPDLEGLEIAAFPSGLDFADMVEHYECSQKRKRGDNAEERNKEQSAA